MIVDNGRIQWFGSVATIDLARNLVMPNPVENIKNTETIQAVYIAGNKVN